MLRMVIRVISAHRKHMVGEKRVKSSAAASSIENFNANLSINGQTTDKYTTTAVILDGGRWMPGPGIARSTLKIAKCHGRKERGEWFFHPLAIALRHRERSLAYVGARARRTSNPNERAADDGRTFKHGRFSVLKRHPFRRARLQRIKSVRARSEKPTEQNPPCPFFAIPGELSSAINALSQISPINDALLSKQAHSSIIILIVTYPPFSPLSAHFNSFESRHSVWNGIENMYNNTGYPMWVLYIIKNIFNVHTVLLRLGRFNCRARNAPVEHATVISFGLI